MQASEGQMLTVFAHELREPLASILFAVQLMEEAACAEHSCRELRSLVERQGKYVARMISDILEIHGESTGNMRLHKEWFDFKSALTGAVETARPLFSERHHRLSISLPSDSVDVFADPIRIRQIVVNLLVNAAKYTASGGNVVLLAELADERVVIEVRDNGIGLSEAILPHVFELYRRGNESPEQKLPGLGVGLALVKCLVEMHEGSVEAQSDGVGKGSTFVARFPCPLRRKLKAQNATTMPPEAGLQNRLRSDDFMADA